MDMDLGAAQKRDRFDTSMNDNAGFKRSKREMDSISIGIRSKSKPFTKYFSTTGCPFGEDRHFLHFVPGGYNAMTQMTQLRSLRKENARKKEDARNEEPRREREERRMKNPWISSFRIYVKLDEMWLGDRMELP
ncbi:hypothetical protein Sjap_023854 [Stephania japonica]|uniref:Uncharacterized protein n=1 Tax=Stephania japonica TaxID=461633 RepID=A0AAP0EH48_9MAGN